MKRCLPLALALITLLFVPKITLAAQSFSVLQPNFLIQISPATTITETVVIKSTSAGAQTVKVSWESYKLSSLTKASSNAESAHALDFVTLNLKDIELQPKGTGSVGLTFAVPENISSGDYYGTLKFTSGTEIDQTEFTLRILGNLKEKLILKSFSKNGSQISLQITNEGNITSQVKTETKINDILGQVDTLKSPTRSVRAGELITIQGQMKTLLPGLYQAQVRLIYGQKNTQATSLHPFWIWPQFFVLFGLILIVIFWELFKKRKKHV